MNEAEAIGMVLIALASIIGMFSAVAGPLLRLNKTMTELETTLKCMRERNSERDASLQDHEKRLGRVEDTATEHEFRITRIENDGKT